MPVEASSLQTQPQCLLKTKIMRRRSGGGEVSTELAFASFNLAVAAGEMVASVLRHLEGPLVESVTGIAFFMEAVPM